MVSFYIVHDLSRKIVLSYALHCFGEKIKLHAHRITLNIVTPMHTDLQRSRILVLYQHYSRNPSPVYVEDVLFSPETQFPYTDIFLWVIKVLKMHLEGLNENVFFTVIKGLYLSSLNSIKR